MFKIPKQLNKCRFIKTYRKNPIECGWVLNEERFKKQEDGSYLDILKNIKYKSKGELYKGNIASYSSTEIQKHIEVLNASKQKSITYGVLCGYNGLVVLDLDDKKLADKLKNIYPFNSTFTVKSAGKGLPHFYFKCEKFPQVIRFDNSTGKRILDIQGNSTYVIGPESRYTSANEIKKYEIINESEILEISQKELLKIIEENIDDVTKIQKQEKNVFTDKFFLLDPITEQIFEKISCTKILEEAGVDISSNPGDTPFADSMNGKCLHRTKYLYFDHHIQEGGNVIQLFSKIYNIDYIKAKYDLAEQAGVTEEIYKQALQYYIKNQQHEMTELLAMKFKSSNPTYVIRSDKIEEVYVYDDDGIYKPNGKTKIKEFCDKILNKWYTTSLANKIIDKIIVRSYISSSEFFKQSPSKYIPLKNGILNIKTRELIDYSPKFKFFNKLPIKYDPTATCENTINHYRIVLNGEQDVLTMQEIYGHLLYREYLIEKAFIFYGHGGNGKTISTNQMGAFLGEDNIKSFSLQTLQDDKYTRGELYGIMANLADEIGNAKLEETQIFKQLTGNSKITAERKYLDTITFTNNAKMLFSANKIPETVDDTDGFWRRWGVLGFNKKFINPTLYDDLKENNLLKLHYRRANTRINEILTTPSELSGVLNWALIGLNRLIEKGKFTLSDSYNEVRRKWRRAMSPTVAFIQDELILTRDPRDFIEQNKLYSLYIDYCINHKIIADNLKMFKHHLSQENVIAQRKKISTGYEYRFFTIKLKNNNI